MQALAPYSAETARLFIVPKSGTSAMSTPKFLKDYGVVLTLFGALLIAYVAGFISISGQISQQSMTLHTKIDAVNKDLTGEIGKIETRATKLESAVKALGDNQATPLKGLVHDLLAAAANALPKNTAVAARAINVVDSLIVTLKKQKQPADAQYFQTTVSEINDLNARIGGLRGAGTPVDLRAQVYSTKISLAEYRSALEPAPLGIAGLSWLIIAPGTRGAGDIGQRMTQDQVNWNFEFAPQEGIKVVLPLKGFLSENVRISHAYIKGGENILDGIHWTNVVFIGSRVVYHGGEVELQNVHFVNCVFEVLGNENGSKFTTYAVLAETHLVIPG